MKLLRITSILSILFTIILINLNCSDEHQIINGQSSNSDNININNSDTPDDHVLIIIMEYVKVEDGFSVSYEWRTLNSFTCGMGACFAPPYYSILHTSFNTPVSPRNENGKTITTQYFKVYDSYSWFNITPVSQYAGTCMLYRSSPSFIQYYSTLYPFPNSQGTYGTESGNLSLPSNTTILLDYGITQLQGGD